MRCADGCILAPIFKKGFIIIEDFYLVFTLAGNPGRGDWESFRKLNKSFIASRVRLIFSNSPSLLFPPPPPLVHPRSIVSRYSSVFTKKSSVTYRDYNMQFCSVLNFIIVINHLRLKIREKDNLQFIMYKEITDEKLLT